MTKLKTKHLNPFPWFCWSLINTLALSLGHSLQFSRILISKNGTRKDITCANNFCAQCGIQFNFPAPHLHIQECDVSHDNVHTVLFHSLPILILSGGSPHCFEACRFELLDLYPTSSFMLSTKSFDAFFPEGHFLALHPLSCSHLYVCKHGLPQDKQKKRAFPHFPIEAWHEEWWMRMMSFIMHTEEKNGVQSKWIKGYL